MAFPVPARLAALYRPRAVSRQLTVSMSLTNKGLLNPAGENNCFLNSTVQVLWHLDVFRKSFRKFEGHCCIGKSCIFCALKVLFTQFQHSDQSALPPDVLRNAMAECYQEQHRFQLGLMDDAAECFIINGRLATGSTNFDHEGLSGRFRTEKILEQIHLHLTGSDDMDSCSFDFCLPHQKFALNMLERTECVCKATSEPLAFIQFVHYISTSALVSESWKRGDVGVVGGRDALFSRLIKAASAIGELKQCPNYEHCKKMVSVKRTLLNSPDIVCIGLIWDSDQPAVSSIMNVTHSIGLCIYLSDVFEHVVSDSARRKQYDLMAVVAYYGRHYITFCYHSVLKEWIYFDDAKFRKVGSEWSDVVELIRKAHYQPLLLVYADRFASPVDTSNAPTETKLVSFGEPTSSSSMPTVVEEKEEEGEKKGDLPTNQITAAVGSDSQLTNHIHTSTSQSPANATTGQPTNQIATSQVGQQPTNRIAAATQQLRVTEAIDPLTLSIVPAARLYPQSSGEGVTLQRGGRISPVSGHNAGSNVQLVPTKPGELPGQSAQYGSSAAQAEEDLMMFSISPLVAQNARETAGKDVHPKPAAKGDSSAPDLMAFSSTVQAQMRRSIHPSPHQPSSALERMPISSTSGLRSHSSLNSSCEMSPSTEATRGKVLRASQPNATSECVNQFQTWQPQPQTGGTQPPQPANQDMLAEDLIAFSISPVNLSKATAKYSDEGVKWDQSSNSKPQNLKTYGSAPSSEPSQPTLSHVSPMKYTPLSHLSKSDQSDTRLSKPTGLQSMQSQPHAPQLAAFSSTGRYPNFFTPTSKQFPSQTATTRAGLGAVMQHTRPYGMWEKFESNTPSPAITSTPQSSGKERQTVEFQRPRPGLRLSAPSAPLPSLLQPQPSKVIHQPQMTTPHPHATLTQLGSAQKSQSLPSDRRKQGSPNVMSFTTGAASGPLVPTTYHHQSQPYTSSSSDKRESSAPPLDLTKEDITVSSPVGGGTLNERSRNVHRPGGIQLSSNRSHFSPHLDPTYAIVDELPGNGSETQAHADTAGVAIDTRQAGHKPPPLSISETNAATTGKLVNLSSPLITGDDPLYAVPSKVLEKAHPTVPQAVGMSASGGDKGGGGGESGEGSSGVTLNESAKSKLMDAMNKFAMAEASCGSDDAVALILYTEAATIFGKLLYDPAVVDNSELCQQIILKREESMRKYDELKRHPPATMQQMTCLRCGRVRTVNEYLLCGPCSLRVKIGK